MRIAKFTTWIMAAIMGAFVALQGSLAMAELPAGHPIPKGTGFQGAVTDVARDIHWLDHFLLIIITLITIFVTALMVYVVVRFNKKANPKPSTFSHNSVIEVIWTAVPVLILVVIAIPSLRLLFFQLDVPENPDVTIKATGNQWYWSYEYPDDGISFDSLMVAQGYATWADVEKAAAADKDLQAEIERTGLTKDTWHLQTDTEVVVPVDKVVHLLVTGSDVIHAWTIPSFGSKIDAVPGRLNETWFKADTIGTYYGQCSELCGINHSYMPITVKVVSQADYDAWISTTKQAQNGGATKVAADAGSTTLASAE